MISEKLRNIREVQLSPLDYLPQENLRENLVDLVLRDVPEETPVQARQLLSELRAELIKTNVEGVKVVVFGGGTGLSNLIGGDSRLESWIQNPFCGLKKYFPHCKSIVCVTDDGGSTGELLKDLPLVAIGDIRHVLLSSIRLSGLQARYNVTADQAQQIATICHSLFNHRCSGLLQSGLPKLKTLLLSLDFCPRTLKKYLVDLIDYLFIDTRLATTLQR
ncbi:MAG: YvcK family protein, partial [Desulfobulbaceae bacterium]|nr:YvcK family protein [Desulfobulbaceae bacterium]